MATVQIPILFDVDNGSTTALELFGESASTDFFTHQVEFSIAKSAKLAATDMQAIHVGDGADDDGEKIFFASDANAIDRMCDKIADALIQGTLEQESPGNAKLVKGGGALDDYFDTDIGDGNMGAQLAKIACIHLVGHPLAQALFSNEQKIQDELLSQTGTATSTSEAVAVGYTDSGGNDVAYTAATYHTRLSQQIAGLLGGTQAGNTGKLAAGNTSTAVLKSTAKENTALKSIFEQLMNVAGRSNSITTAQEDATDNTKTTTAALPFASDDSLVIFVRAKLKLSVETAVMGSGSVKLVDSAGADLTSNQFITGNGSTAASLASAFPPTADADSATGGTVGKFNWMGAATNDTFGDATTDVTDTSTLDCHIMKITIALN